MKIANPTIHTGQYLGSKGVNSLSAAEGADSLQEAGTALGDDAGNTHRMLKISAHRLDGSSGSQRFTSIPQQMQGGAAGGVGVEVGRRGAGETLRLRI